MLTYFRGASRNVFLQGQRTLSLLLARFVFFLPLKCLFAAKRRMSPDSNRLNLDFVEVRTGRPTLFIDWQRGTMASILF